MDKPSYRELPVLIMIFNRPDCVESVIKGLRAVAPARVFLAADGPRPNRPGEEKLCREARERAQKAIDWPCELQCAFQEKNLGCGEHVTKAISWFFSQVEYGVILEDDCVPSVAFFRYEDELLRRYAENPSVMMISGSALVRPDEDTGSDYNFVAFPCCWGWGSWRRAWEKMSYEMPDFPAYRDSGKIFRSFSDRKMAKRLLTLFEKVYTHAPGFDTWDFQWLYACVKNEGLCVLPALNFISNVGWDSCHRRIDEIMEISKEDFQTLRHPEKTERNVAVERKFYDTIYALDPLWKRALQKILLLAGRK